MKQRQLGRGGPMVSAIGLGCMSFAGFFGTTSTAESLRCLDAAVDHGITLLDTANVYGAGVSESAIGIWLKTGPKPVHIATKASLVDGPPRRFDNSEPHLRAELDASLRRLGVDHVALFYLHRHDQERPIEEVAETMGRLIDEGKIGGYGLSEVSPGTVRRAHAVRPCRAVQSEYSLWTRQPELGLIQTCAELGVAFVPFSPLARGAFGREILAPQALANGDFRKGIPRFQGADWDLNRAKFVAFQDLAAGLGLTTPALALAWILDQAPHLIPIPGTRSADHLADWAGAGAVTLSPQTRADIARTLPVGWAHGDRYDVVQAMSVERYC